MSIANIKDGWFTLFEQGGITLWVIFAVSILMWLLILERFWYLRFELPKAKQECRVSWAALSEQRHDTKPYLARKFSQQLNTKSNRSLLAIQTMTNILPMLGLLGTVSGMITVFEVITVFGTGNSRGMAAGISTALVTTLAGLMTALSGIYFISYLERKIRSEVRHFNESLDLE